MSLFVVSTPIGNTDDITLRAINTLKKAEVIIGEEFRETTTLLKKLEVAKPQLETLNEHSKPEELDYLVNLCRDKFTVLISDCGTPGFCDPGAELVALCRKKNITVTPVPGASSLMTVLAVSGRRLNTFIFRGFLPAKREDRDKALDEVAKDKKGQILMDTPYRLEKLLQELRLKCPQRTAFLGLDMTTETELYLSDTIINIDSKLPRKKAEFVLILDEL